ncbi:hypothetical protein A3F03_03105 [Candidatus Roizmanbacteria bacterium RIFCSPHIGHO2_12_FULL_41_11]|uniref:GH18 domain-containing protein n=1 Tax=Candidatus Roizmanbacteria bacterium RIFCSPHIGHO2_12_FULL_41_11 TaxID=1802052 RepID=A0A1F7I2V4_9BACT|nr:MAG: hypothetical protein A3F03_03105 [Candidatus Roizmanbacteria bacterium RIFCSPHIGHO2_12_FULL_41_11]
MGKIFIAIFAIIAGVSIGYYIFARPSFSPIKHLISEQLTSVSNQKLVIGFLPFWLIDKADKNYADYISTLAYFGLILDSDGSIKQYTNPQEAEPGWYALQAGKIDDLLTEAKRKDIKLSLVVFCGDEETIGQLLDKPEKHADRLVEEVTPLMKKFGFSDLNLDIESVKEASGEARLHFTQFVKQVKKGMDQNNAGTLSIDASPTVFIKKYLIDPVQISQIVDHFIIMGYDYHYPGSYVSGPVAPQAGAGTVSEFDTQVAIKIAAGVMPAEKIILAIPLYGYEWETIDDFSRAATIPGSGLVASNRRVEELLKDCEECQISREKEADEAYVVYQDTETGVYHQIFFPDKQATQAKADYAQKNKLGGIALWALGYEGDTILEPLKGYK